MLEREENGRALRGAATVVWLTARLETLERRLGEDPGSERPLLAEPGSLERLERRRRIAYLSAADVVVGVPGETAAPHPSLDGTLDEVVERWQRSGEAARIRQALEAAAGDRSRAAEELGIPLRRLAQRIRELGL